MGKAPFVVIKTIALYEPFAGNLLSMALDGGDGWQSFVRGDSPQGGVSLPHPQKKRDYAR
jgi:hypothetical protein